MSPASSRSLPLTPIADVHAAERGTHVQIKQMPMTTIMLTRGPKLTRVQNPRASDGGLHNK